MIKELFSIGFWKQLRKEIKEDAIQVEQDHADFREWEHAGKPDPNGDCEDCQPDEVQK